MIGFGSMARKELLFVSDIDIQTIVVASEKNTGEAKIYTNNLTEHVKNEWSKIRRSINSSPDANALEVDNIGGNQGVIVVNTPQTAADYMKPKKMGAKGYSDVYADSRPIYESEQGVYRTMFDEYEAKLQNTAVNGLINEALADLGARPKTLSSAKQTFIRPITLAIGGLYRKLRYKLGSKLPYETNTLKRAMFLKENKFIDDGTYKNIEEVLLRAFKWEQESGLENFRHGSQVLSSRASSSKTTDMFTQTSKIKEALSATNDKINAIPVVQR